MQRRGTIADTRKRALISAALQEISEQRSLDVTVARIAKRAGVSSALAYHYFGTKDDLTLATMRHLLTEFRIDVTAGMRAATSPRARLAAIIQVSFGEAQFHHATINTWLTFYAWALSSPGAARLLGIYQRRLHSNLVHALNYLTDKANANRIAQGLGALIDGVYLREALQTRKTDPAAAIAAVENYLDLELAGAAG